MAETVSSVAQLIEEGRRLHRAGQLPRAEAIYRQVLEREPDHAEALHLLGVAASQGGRSAEAIDLITRALERHPDEPKYHLNLGLARRRAGDYHGALQSYRRCIELAPSIPEAHLNLGIALKHLGELDGAMTALKRAVELEPKLAEGWLHLGEALRESGRIDDALPALQRALQLKPHLIEAHTNLALCHARRGRYREALHACETALGLKPDDLNVLQISSGVLRNVGEFADAEECARKAIELKADDALAHLALGHSLFEQGRFAEAGEAYARAIEINAELPEAHAAHALVLLMQGDLERGFAEQRWLWRITEFAAKHRRDFAQPQWDGGDLRGRTILLYTGAETDVAIQLVRFAPALKERGARVIVECPPVMARLLADASGVDRCVGRGDALPEFDAHLPFLSLPQLLGTTLDSIPVTPYLRAPAGAAVKLPKTRRGRLRVGLAWADDASQPHGGERSIPGPLLMPLVRVKGVDAFSLQTGERAVEVERLQAGGHITDLAPQLTDYAEIAAAIAQLDLVITTDNAVAHLAGALGRPALVLLPFIPDWRWMLERADCPWYPTLTLFRQSARGDWQPVIDAAGRELERMAEAGR